MNLSPVFPNLSWPLFAWEVCLHMHAGTDYEMLLQLDQPRQGEASQQPAATEAQLASIPSFTVQKTKV